MSGGGRIGLAGAVFTIVGWVVGASIFILPGELAGQTGPAIFVAYGLAAVPGLFACVVAAQIAAAFPVSGASYVSVSRLLGPLAGFVVVWTVLVLVGVGVPLVAYGTVDYLAYLVPGLPRLPTALGLVALFGVVNLAGVTHTVRVQALMTVLFLAALGVFVAGGSLHWDAGLLRPLMPHGFGGVLAAAVPAYFSYTGFFVLVELGGEVRDAARTIPRALAIAFVLVLACYLGVTAVLPGVLPWQTLAATEAAVSRAAETFLPAWLVAFVTVGAVLAAASSLNGILLTQSRDVYALGRDGVFPAYLGRDDRNGVPRAAVLLVALIALAGVLLGASIADYAVMTVLGFMVLQVLLGLALLRLPGRGAERYRAAPLRMGVGALRVFGGGLVLVSLAFAAIGVALSPASTLLFLLVVALGLVYYAARRPREAASAAD